jgi:hypothetical protein
MAKRLPLLMLTLAVAAAAQDARTAALTGVVSDPAGAVVAGAKVTAVNIATKFTSEGVTNETGRYFIPYLAPGTYELRVEAPGFSRYVRTDIQLRAGDFPRVDVQLQLGAVTESVTVSGAVPLLQTETATTTATLQNRVFMRIPVMQVRTYNILTYLPGVNNTGFNAFNAIGQRNRSMGYSVDGVSAKEPVRGAATHHTETLQTTMDAIEEVRVLTTGLPAEFGRAGSGMIVAVMKSGTNQLHGSAEDRYINRHLLHRRYFDRLPQSPMGYHELAATLSGPVVLPGLYNGRDRTFFLLGWQRHHEKASETAVTAVPTEAMLNGDFSFGGLGYPIFDPFSYEASEWRVGAGSFSRQSYTGFHVRPGRPQLFEPQPVAPPQSAGLHRGWRPARKFCRRHALSLVPQSNGRQVRSATEPSPQVFRPLFA